MAEVFRPMFGRYLRVCLLAGLAVAPTQAAPPELAIPATPRTGLPARAAALLVSGQHGGPIAISTLAAPLAVSGDGTRLGVAIDIDGVSLLAGRRAGNLEVDVAVYAVSADGKVTAAFSLSFVLDVEGGAETIEARGIKLVEALEVPPGTSHLRTLVYVPDGPSFGLLEVPVASLSAGSSDPGIAPPIIAEPPGAWLLAGEAAPGDAAFPFRLGAAPVVPATRPVLVAGAEREAWLITRGLAPGLAGVSAAAVGGETGDSKPIGLRVTGTEAAGGIDITRVVLAVPNLAPGRYTLRLAAPAPPAGGRVIAAELPIVVVGPASDGEVVTWAHVGGPQGGGDLSRRPIAVPPDDAKLQPVATLKAAYLDALTRYVDTGRGGGIAAVTEMESAALAGASRKEAKRLAEAETGATRELMSAAPGSALALLALHLELYQRYGLTGRFALQSQTSARIEELAIAVAVGGGKDARAVAVSALCCFAGEQHWAGDLVIAARMFRRALVLAPGNPDALAGFGAVLEAAGLFSDAVEPLTLLVEGQPDDAEARLRLAVNLVRVGAPKRANALFAACTTAQNPPWIRAVAYQEMVRRLIDKEKWSDAVALTDTALAALPDDQGLAVQRAFALDRSARVVEARAAARRLVGRAGQVSPRYRYAMPLAPQDRTDCQALAALRPGAETELARALVALRARQP